MAILDKADGYTKRVIDLSGPGGNAFALLNTARQWARECSFEKERMDKMMSELQAGDYEHLIATFDYYWGDICDLQR